ncbi:MAG: hypothetical protein OHK0011_14180 [Turneriella sp.]
MKDKSQSVLAARCREKLADASWNSRLAERVSSAHRRQNRSRAIWVSASLLVLAGALSVTAWSYDEVQNQAGMMAMLDEVAYPVFGSAFPD